MAATDDSIKMDVDDDIDTNANEFPLKDLPNEVLILVMSHLNDTSLLDMTLVSERFRALAKEAFAKKYNGATEAAFYHLHIFCENEIEEHRLYHPYFDTFGGNMPAIRIHFDDDSHIPNNHWMYNEVRSYCTVLTKIHISEGGEFNLDGILTERTIQMLTFLRLEEVDMSDESWVDRVYPKLVRFHADSIQFGAIALHTLFANNRQITELQLAYTDLQFDILGQLKGLKSLHITYGEVTFGRHKFQMDSLEKCVLELESPWSTLIKIGAACKHLKELAMIDYDEDEDEDDNGDNGSLEIIYKFKKLTSLRLCGYEPNLDQFKKIIEKLPNLTSLHLGSASHFDILDIFPSCKNLENLIISGASVTPYEENKVFFRDVAELTKVHGSMKVSLIWSYLRAIFTQGRVQIHYIDPDLNPWELVRGIETLADQPEPGLDLLGLDDKCLEKIVGFVGGNSQIALLNTCQRTRKIVKDYLSKQMFYLTNDVDVDGLKTAAEYIHHMNVNVYVCGCWWNDLDFEWPNIRTLILSERAYTMIQLLSLKCPMLTHLEVQCQLTLDDMNVSLVDFNSAYRNLTTLKFGWYKAGAELFLSSLDESVCERMQNLSLSYVKSRRWKSGGRSEKEQCRKYLKLVNILMRFRNLTTLHLLFPSVGQWNLRGLIEKCSKLTDLAICLKREDECNIIFALIKENCRQMRTIRLVGQEEAPFYPGEMQGIQRLLPGVSVEIIYVDCECRVFEFNNKRPKLFTALKF